MSKISLLAVVFTLVVLSSLFVSLIPIKVYASTEFSGIISLNTTWTKANSPYNLVGPIAVNQEVTLTIEPGVTVNLNSYYLQVNGTLKAIGTNSDQIHFNNGQMIFFRASEGNNDLTDTGSVIENTVISGTYLAINNVSPIISNNSITSSDPFTNTNAAITVNGGSPEITNNNLTAPGTLIWVEGISSLNISNNAIASESGQFSIVINTESGVPVISNNIIAGGISDGGSPIISNNIIGGPSGTGIFTWGGASPTISNNSFTGQIALDGYNAFVSSNTLSGFGIKVESGNATIENNLVTNNLSGAGVFLGGGPTKYVYAQVQNNTIANNLYGILVFDSEVSTTIIYNNIRNNTKNSIHWESFASFDAPYNWWGTTDAQAINESIYDFKNDFNLGVVTFLPFLTEPNSEAPPIPNINPNPTPSPTQTPINTNSPSPSPSPTLSPSFSPTIQPTLTPKQSGFLGTNLPVEYGYAVVVVLVIIVVAGLSLVYFKRLRK